MAPSLLKVFVEVTVSPPTTCELRTTSRTMRSSRFETLSAAKRLRPSGTPAAMSG